MNENKTFHALTGFELTMVGFRGLRDDH